MLLHIVRYKILAFLKTTFDLRPVSIVRGLGSLLVFGAFATTAYMISQEVTSYVLVETRTGLFLFHRFISMMLFVFFVSVNLGNIIVSYATLYRSPEVVYLLTKPVPHMVLFVQKFLDNFLYSSTTLFLAAFMVLLGYGSFFGYSWYLILALLVFVLIPFMFLSACLGVLILMGVMRLAGRIGFRNVMGILAGLYLLMVYFFFKFSNPIKLVEEVGQFYPNVNLYLAQLDPRFVKVLPNHWVAEFLFFLSKGDVAQALPFAALLLAVTAAAFVLVLIVADRYYYRSWLVAFEAQTSRRLPRIGTKPGLLDFRHRSPVSSQFEVLLKKEFFLFFREPSQWIHFGVMVVLIVVFISSVRRLDFLMKVPDLPMYTYLVLFGFSGFMSAALALRFVFPMVSLEGQPFWALRTSPMSLKLVYLTKLAIGVVLVAALALVVAYFSNLPFAEMAGRSRQLIWFGLSVALVMSVAMASLNLGFGGYFVNYQEKNPIRIASSQGATLTFLFTLVFLIVAVSSFLIPIANFFDAWMRNGTYSGQGFVTALLAFVPFSLVLALFGAGVGLRSLRRDF